LTANVFNLDLLFSSKILEESMKSELKNELLVELTAQESATINGGRRGEPEPGDDRGGNGRDDGPNHQ
jgi:hypothetical protein